MFLGILFLFFDCWLLFGFVLTKDLLAQAGLKLTVQTRMTFKLLIILPLPPGAGIMGMNHIKLSLCSSSPSPVDQMPLKANPHPPPHLVVSSGNHTAGSKFPKSSCGVGGDPVKAEATFLGISDSLVVESAASPLAEWPQQETDQMKFCG